VQFFLGRVDGGRAGGERGGRAGARADAEVPAPRSSSSVVFTAIGEGADASAARGTLMLLAR
jgi:hypothetical protein